MSDTVDTSAEAVTTRAKTHWNGGDYETAALLRALLRERDEARAEIAAREQAARETRMREAASEMIAALHHSHERGETFHARVSIAASALRAALEETR